MAGWTAAAGARALVEQIGVVIGIVAKACVFDARHEKGFASDLTGRVLRALREAGIALPGAAVAAVAA